MLILNKEMKHEWTENVQKKMKIGLNNFGKVYTQKKDRYFCHSTELTTATLVSVMSNFNEFFFSEIKRN